MLYCKSDWKVLLTNLLMLCWRLTFSGAWEACGAAQGLSKETDSLPLLVIILAGEGRNLLWAVAQVLLPVLPLFLMKPQHRPSEWLVGCDPSIVNRSLESNSCVEVVVAKFLSFLMNLKSFSFLWHRKLKCSSFLHTGVWKDLVWSSVMCNVKDIGVASVL